MANKKISELQSRTPVLSDLMLVGDPSSGYSYKCTVTALATIIETDIADGYVTIGTAQTISGAKTFSNNLTLTSVVNTPTDPDKFLTLNASNVVTYRTGSQVLSDIGAADDSLVVHLAGTETITGYKTFSSFAGFDSAISIKQNSTIVSQTGYGSIAASSTGFFLTRATGIHAFFNLNSLTTGRNFTFPDVTGTIALTSDITDALAGYVPTSRTLTINGVTQSLAANRTFNVGTVETVNFATGTTGTDVNVSGSPITTTGTITLNIPTASATNRGALSSTDWSTFNNKQSAISLTTTGNSGAATFVSNTLNIPNYTLSGLGGISGSGTTNYIPKFTSSSAIGDSPLYDASGSIGLNSTTPALNGFNRELTVNAGTSGTARAAINIQGSRTSASTFGVLGFFHQTTYVAGIESSRGGDATSGILQFFTSNTTGATERMRLDASGNLGLGTTTTTGKLNVSNGNAHLNNYFVTGTSAGWDIKTYFTGGNAGSEQFIYFGYPTAETDVFIQRGSNGRLAFGTTATTRLTLDASGNLGLGVTPSNSTLPTIQSTYGALSGNTNISIVRNAYYNSGWKYTATGQATFYQQDGGSHIWYNATSGTAGNTISFTQAMTLDASGRLGIGTTTITAPLTVAGTSDLAWSASTSKLQISRSGSVARLQNYEIGSAASLSLQWDGGNVGIGTTSPAYKLVVSNGGALGFEVDPTSSSGGVVEVLTYNRSLGAYKPILFSAEEFRVATSSSERMRITSGGNVGIGTTSPAGLFTSYQSLNGDPKLGYFYNDNGGSAAEATVYVLNSSSANDGLFLQTTGTAFTTVGGFVQDGSAIGSGTGASGGLSIMTRAAADMRFYTNGHTNERMRITSGGNVGIGTTSPAGQFEVYTDGYRRLYTSNIDAYTIRLVLGANSYIQQDAGNEELRISQQYGSGKITFYTGATNSERMRITSGGNLLVGSSTDAGYGPLQIGSTSTASTRLQILSSTTGDAAIHFGDATSGTDRYIGYLLYDHSNNLMTFGTNGGERMRLNSSGELLINTTSDAGDYKLQVNGKSYLNGDVALQGNNFIPTTKFIQWEGGAYWTTRVVTSGNQFEIYRGDTGASPFIITSSNNAEFSGSIKTAAPSGGTAGAWKLGTTETFSCTPGGGGNGFSTTVVRIDIGGTAYFIPTVTDGWC